MTHVTLKNSAGSRLTVLLGDTSPVLSDGVTTWDTVSRPKRTAVTRYTGRNPFKQDIAVMFDGLADSKSQEGAIAKLQRMASAPHIVELSGHALRTDLDWVFNGSIDWDNQQTIWQRIGKETVRVRQSAVIHLLEYIKDTVIKTPASPDTAKLKKSPSRKVTIPQGMTLKQIAVIEFGDPDKWRRIVIDNPWLAPGDPRQVVPAGITLEIFDGAIPFFTVP